jgi:hypothetical protein
MITWVTTPNDSQMATLTTTPDDILDGYPYEEKMTTLDRKPNDNQYEKADDNDI